MDEGGVDAAVIHPPGWVPNSTALALQAVRDYPGRFAIMGAHDIIFSSNARMAAPGHGTNPLSRDSARRGPPVFGNGVERLNGRA